ncbi:4' [Octopus vulgaris]|uniref:4'-phosphopantetheine phosphatase n=1 Tax=Octopus vulgaris TaxID=6645 RepID=A0AA36BWH9_OCTVU|nr:4' [Octopus vulgaris]
MSANEKDNNGNAESSSSSVASSTSSSSSWLQRQEESVQTKPIELPSEKVFKNLKNAQRIAIDIGGSLAKIAYCSLVHQKSFLVSEEVPNKSTSIYEVSETDEYVPRLYFIQFETKYIETCIDYIQENLLKSTNALKTKSIKATGGGSWKHKDLIEKKLGLELSMENEVNCLIKGCNFLLKNIPDEAFIFQRYQDPECKFQGVDSILYPFLLVNIGSGVIITKVESENKYEWVGGTATGGATFWGLGSLLTKGKSFNELLLLAEEGNSQNVDMLVKDIYGLNTTALNLPAELLASSFGKAPYLRHDITDDANYKSADAISSLLFLICNDIGQISSLYAELHHCNKIYFGGGFIRSNPLTMHILSGSIKYWSKAKTEALFLRHEGYLGAVGSFLVGAEEDDEENYVWGENLANNSGLTSPREICNRTKSCTFDSFELECLECELTPCPLILDISSYRPDTVDLTEDSSARNYWLKCFAQVVDKITDQAVKSQDRRNDAMERAEKFKAKYLHRLKELDENPCAYGSLTVRCLLDTIGHFLKEFMFTDAYSQLKLSENELSLRHLANRLDTLDNEKYEGRMYSLVKGVLAGNMFDWGAKQVVDIMETQNFGFAEAMNKIQARPWLVDDFELWVSRRLSGPAYKCAAVFCDNSGADIVLGLFPFVRDLIMDGTKVILCANSRPSLNDILYTELSIIVKRIAELDKVIAQALTNNQLLVMESGQGSPCLDLRLIDKNLANRMLQCETDLIILEGMGRAIHTNYHACFSCDSLKMAIIKNEWLAQRLGGKIFDVIFKFETNCQNIPPSVEK